MAGPDHVSPAQEQTVARRRERANRILDAAAALILRWGYDKTSIDDIARHAGVAKGTIYLHWKTREGLFQALLVRDALAMTEDVKQRIAQDAESPPLRLLIKCSALAVLQRPLIRALLLGDMEVLGKLSRRMQGGALHREKLGGFQAFLEILRERHMVRADLSLKAQVFAISAIFMGFFLMAPLVPDDFAPSDEEFADLLAEMVHSALDSGRTVPRDESKAVCDAVAQYLERYTAALRRESWQGAEDDPARQGARRRV